MISVTWVSCSTGSRRVSRCVNSKDSFAAEIWTPSCQCLSLSIIATYRAQASQGHVDLAPRQGSLFQLMAKINLLSAALVMLLRLGLYQDQRR